ncbi:YezD family protein [Desulfitobacterium sp.]|uniref:YezD family protein n=1 Tax=Desulfitobacterium sp. TaxID=49981 RepID=UPI002C7DB0EF|nr:YezD family protein [Desulfitobacterium sp.]HVJ50635.1 YezD family protein [Desulfitobacterium sp.]
MHEPDKEPHKPSWLEELLIIIKTVKHGSITLIIQDGIVIQIDKNEKIRLKRP